MSPTCPLPVDWLDYLDGAGERAQADHLSECISCQTLLASLSDGRQVNVAPDWANAFAGRTDAVWHEQSGKQPARGEFWFSAPRFALDVAGVELANSPSFSYEEVDRVLMLVLTDQTEENNFRWHDVVPVLSDVEQATETDLLIAEQESTLGGPWRALFAHQMKVAQQQLDTYVGSLSTGGMTTLLAALEGSADDSRWGIPLQGPADPRAWLDRDFECALLRLRSPWLLIREAGLIADREGSKAWLRLVPEPGESKPVGRESGKLHWLVPVKEPPQELALAAASTATRKPDVWRLDTDLVQLVGRLEVDWGKGLLVFFVSAATLRAAVRVRLRLFAHGEDHASELFVPAKNIKVALAQEVSKEAVEKLGAEVIP